MLLSPTATAEHWGQFRGPHFNGFADEKDLPSQWSTTEGVKWQVDLPGSGDSTPVVWGDRVFVSSTDPSVDRTCAICLDRSNGKLLWRHDIGGPIRRDSRSTFTGPSPATDGRVVVFFFGDGNLVTFDLDGKELWRRDIQQDYGPFAFQWTFSSSPLLYQEKLYLQILQRDTPVHDQGLKDRPNESYLLALDPNTGKEIWRVVRPTEAKEESRESFTTPMPYEHDGRQELLIAGGDMLSGHDPATGKELWRWGTWNPERIGHWRLVPSPIAGKGIVLACAPKNEPVYAIRLGGNGVLSDQFIAWTSTEMRDITSDVPTPAFAYGDFFLLSDGRKKLIRVDPLTGQIRWNVRTPGSAKYEASPLVADGKVYLINFSSQVAVFDAETGKELSVITMDTPRDDAVRSSIIASDGELFVRTTQKLFCIK